MSHDQETIMATQTDPTDTSGAVIAASKVNGTNVYNPGGDKLGSIYDVMLNKQSGRATYAIMSFGGFLGIGEKYHPLPWAELRYDPVQDGYVVNIDRGMLEGAPAYDSYDTTAWGDASVWGPRVNDYYDGPGRSGGSRMTPGLGVMPPG
jgi:sporulation protein YlmC with PRC-barrel domain